MRNRTRRVTIREVLDTAIELERRTMQLYTALVTVFKGQEELRRFWFGMARHEAGHCGALALVESLLEADPSLAATSKVWFDETTVARLRALLGAYLRRRSAASTSSARSP
jgi:rubrerythrin